jgi:hypothetical protein
MDFWSLFQRFFPIGCHWSSLVLLPGFQKGRDIKSSLKEKGSEQFWPKKGNLKYKEKLEKPTEFHSF